MATSVRTGTRTQYQGARRKRPKKSGKTPAPVQATTVAAEAPVPAETPVPAEASVEVQPPPEVQAPAEGSSAPVKKIKKKKRSSKSKKPTVRLSSSSGTARRGKSTRVTR